LLRSVDEYRMVLYSLLLIVLMLVRPKGLFNFDFVGITARLRARLRGAGSPWRTP
jgi:branched-chain amino acid transport system permease protein